LLGLYCVLAKKLKFFHVFKVLDRNNSGLEYLLAEPNAFNDPVTPTE